MTDTTRIVRFYEEGGPMKLEALPLEPPGPGEARLRVKAIGLNRVEALFHAGRYFVRPVLPSKLGIEASGIVEAVGIGVDAMWMGKRVALIPAFDMTKYGVAGESATVPAELLIEMPDHVSFEQGAAAWMAYLTAYGALVPNNLIRPRDFILVNAASSSVGLALIQMVRALGAHSIAVTRTAAKKQALIDLGADHVIAMASDDLVAEVKAITRGAGVRVAFDPVAGQGIMQLAAATADNGTVIIGGFLGTDMFGFADGQPTPFPFIDAVARNLNIRGYSARGLMADADGMAKAKHFIGERLASGEFKPKIDRIFPIEQIETAYEHMRTGSLLGKIVVVAELRSPS
jgi:NADPH:quinone reductase-like Zn-dependent oxidoreductase